MYTGCLYFLIDGNKNSEEVALPMNLKQFFKVYKVCKLSHQFKRVTAR